MTRRVLVSEKNRWFVGIILLLAVFLSAAGSMSAQEDAAHPPFEEVTVATGIAGPRTGNEKITGQAWGDYDRDGWVDLYLTDFGFPLKPGPNRLLRNNGDGTFSPSPLAEPLALADVRSSSAVWADYNNDGWLDLYVVNWGANQLFRNEAGQGFTDVTTEAGVGDITNGKTASWGDYDNDGFLDLYVANWSCTPNCGRPSEGDNDNLYHNNGDGTFTDVTLLLSHQTWGAGFIAGFVDFDDDGDLDIYLVNDEFLNPVGNALWRNDGAGCGGWCFADVSQAAGADQRVMGMGLAVGDPDNDLDFDFYFSNVGPMTLLMNQGDGKFINKAEEAGVRLSEAIGWGTVFLDYDNDGWQDLYLAQMVETDGGVGINPLFHNNGDGTFTNLAENSGAGDPGKTIGVSTADYDRDGYVDLIIGNYDEGYKLFRNTLGDQGAGGNWIAVRPTGAGSVNRDAIGAKVYVTADDGLVQMRQLMTGTGLGGNSDLELHFGLGAANIDSLRIVWPDGTEQSASGLKTNARYTLAYGEAPLLLDGGQTAHLPHGWLWVVAGLVAVVGVAALAIALRGRVSRPSWPLLRPAQALAVLAILTAGTLLWLARDTLAERLAGGGSDGRLSLLLAKSGVNQLDPGPTPDPAVVRLGEALFYDKILSGNRDISCATCHHPQFAGADGLPLSLGTGGHGLGPARVPGDGRTLIPRNASDLFNRGSPEWTTMFWDGRVNISDIYGLSTPVGNGLPSMIDTPLEAQGLFPVTSREEMRGDAGDLDRDGQPNELATIDNMEPKVMWAGLMARLLAVPGYVELFHDAYPDTPTEELGFEHASYALAAYEIAAFTFMDSPWDRYLAGDGAALSEEARRGAILFYGAARCNACHGGNLLTDQQYHNIAVPQLGPGKLSDVALDLGRFLETGLLVDRYAFRTPPLRNVTLTAPYMHNGAYDTLEGAIRHHLYPTDSLRGYDPTALPVAFRETVRVEPEIQADVLKSLDPLAASPPELTDAQIGDLLAFLESLTSPSAVDLSGLVPDTVPSGLPVGD